MQAPLGPLAAALRRGREPLATCALAAMVYALVALLVPITRRPQDPALAMLAVLAFALLARARS